MNGRLMGKRKFGFGKWIIVRQTPVTPYADTCTKHHYLTRKIVALGKGLLCDKGLHIKDKMTVFY